MSRIKQEIDRALEYYGDRATVFRVVRKGVEAAIIIKMIRGHKAGLGAWPMLRKKYIYHIRRLLPIDRPVTTERLKQEYDYSEGNAILRKELTERPAKFIAALQDYLEQE